MTQAIDLAIDATGDLALSGGSPYLVSGTDATMQRLRIKFRFILGEWFADTREGLPYRESIFGKQDPETVKAWFRRVLLEDPGIASVETLTLEVDSATRTGAISFRAIAVDGRIYESADFGTFEVSL